MAKERVFKPRQASAAEHRIHLLAVEAGAVVHPVVDDQNGWDCLIEFEPLESDGPPDLAAPGLTLMAQVKSSAAARTTCVITLSNALKYANHTLPCFIVLIAPDAVGSRAIYVRHVWKDLIADILQRVRKAHLAGFELHRKRMTVTFSDEDRLDEEAVKHMARTLDTLGPRYAVQKQEMRDALGYEDVAGTGKLVFAEGIDAETLVDLSLGLVESLPISRFTYTDARFGLSSPDPEIDHDDGEITITPTPAGKCSVTIRDPDSEAEVNLEGDVFTPGIPHLPREYWKLRIRTNVLEVILKQGTGQISSKTDLETFRPFSELLQLSAVWAWASKGGLEMQVWSDGRLLSGSRVEMAPMQDGPQWCRLRSALEALAYLAPEGRWPTGMGFTPRSLFERMETLSEFRALLQDSGVKLDFVFVGEVPQPVRIAVPIFLQLDDYLFTAIMERPCVSMEQSGSKITMSLGPPTIKRGAILKGTPEEHMRFIDQNLRAAKGVLDPEVMMIAPPADTVAS
ncbi:DUF4365 domain-containing protein [Brevundimonas sp. FT23042]|uniref:DUF4365 domain-containing protein n=1 Tax=Brevundimonas sp. FT23042 TaxID=3393749 RepID=UPI003B58A207